MVYLGTVKHCEWLAMLDPKLAVLLLIKRHPRGIHRKAIYNTLKLERRAVIKILDELEREGKCKKAERKAAIIYVFTPGKK